jgi:hypothetical protein
MLKVEENEAFTHVATCMVEGQPGRPDIIPGQTSIVKRDEEGALWVGVHLVNMGDDTINIEVGDVVGTCMPLAMTLDEGIDMDIGDVYAAGGKDYSPDAYLESRLKTS